MIPFLASIIGAIQGAYSAAASTFLASFPTPALAAALSMAGNKITGLGAATAAGDALRFESNGPGTLSTAAPFATQILPTNWTETSFADSETGTQLIESSATATARAGGRVTAGSQIAGQIRTFGGTVGSSSATTGGGCLLITRADGKIITLGKDANSTNVYYWTSKDAFGALRASIGDSNGHRGSDVWYRLGSVAGNIVAEISLDGTNWYTLYSAAIATAFGDAGAVTAVGLGALTSANGAVQAVKLSRHTVTP